MASSYSADLKLELMLTGENSGTWGDKTNTNLKLIQQAVAGYQAIDVAGADVTLAMTNATISNARNMVLKLTGSLAGNRAVKVPDSIEKVYVVVDGTTRNGFTLTVKTVSGTGVAMTAAQTNFVYADGTNVVDTGFKSDALVNLVEDTTPQLGGALDVNGNNIVSVSNGNINIAPHGTGVAQVAGAAIRAAGSTDMWVPAASMTATTTNGCADIAQTEISAGNPDFRSLDFDAASDEHAQFSVAFPKSWNEGTVTFRAYWTNASTETNGVAWFMQGAAVSNAENIAATYGTAVGITDTASGTANQLAVTGTSGAITISGTPAEGDAVWFRLFRDVSDGADTLTVDAKLLGLLITWTTDAINDS